MSDLIDAAGSGSDRRIVEVDPAGLDDALGNESSVRPFGVLLITRTADEFRSANDVIKRHADLLARACVGMVVVAEQPVAEELAGRAGSFAFPFTALRDRSDALGWLAGQLAAGPTGVRPAGAGKTIGLGAALQDYVESAMSQPGDPVHRRMHHRALERFGDITMTIAEDQARLLKLLVEITGARRAVEIGTFIGTSALWIARGLGPEGRLTCFDLEADYIELARVGWAEAGVDSRIDVVIGRAVEGLAELDDEPIDFVFIDADKEQYATYVDLLLPKLSDRGMIAIDNTLWGGAVVDPRWADQPATAAIRALTADLAGRHDLDVLLLTVGDGMTVLRRR